MKRKLGMRYGSWSLALLATLLLLVVHPALAAELTGHVVALADGDTPTILTDAKEQVRIRLAEIDTPRRGQP